MEDDTTAGMITAGSAAVTCTNSSGAIKFNIVTAATHIALKAYVEVDVTVYLP